MSETPHIHSILDVLIREQGSDLHLSAKHRPTIRVSGELIAVSALPVLYSEEIEGMLELMMSDHDKEIFESDREVDFAYAYEKKARFRCNAFVQRGHVSVAMRLIPQQIRTLEELSLPTILQEFIERKQGFFLVVGPIGQGKSTTLASLLEMINVKRTEHILTIEDPIEYEFKEKRSIIDQRQVRSDTQDFSTALNAMFRQDVNVVMVGEMRGLDTMRAAVTAAETGHLVFSTLHTNNASQTIDRIIDSFPPHQQNQIRVQLAASLTAIFSQRLIPRVGGGMVPAFELLINNSAIANLIREARTHEINSIIETSSEQGMIDMNRSLAALVRSGEISIESAHRYSLNPRGLIGLL